MKKTLLLVSLLSLAVLTVGGARAQSRFSSSAGLGLVPTRANGPGEGNPVGYAGIAPGYVLETSAVNYLLVQASLGFDAPLLRWGRGEQSLGVSLNAAFGVLAAPPSEAADSNGAPLLDLPQYVTYRYGARASRDSEKAWGVGVGAGYRFSRFALPFNSPSVMLEGVYGGKSNDYFLRLSADLVPQRFYNRYSSEGLVEVLRYQELNLQLGRSF